MGLLNDIKNSGEMIDLKMPILYEKCILESPQKPNQIGDNLL